MTAAKNTFVFVVCGSKEHIDTLNFSLPYLRRYSDSDILVVTDLQRNSGEIAHDQVLQVETPPHYDHHQASIFLKTGLHKWLDLEQGRYCYLDSDVLAVRKGVDDIFGQMKGPVTFAADHCRLSVFSPYAVTCGCLDLQYERQDRLAPLRDALIDSREGVSEGSAPDGIAILPEKHRELLSSLQDWANRTRVTDPALRAKRDQLLELFAQARAGGAWKLATTSLFRILPRFVRHPFRRIWYDWSGNVVVHEDAQSYFGRRHGLIYQPEAGGWYDQQSGQVLEGFDELIREQTGNRKTPGNEQYEDNAGVQLFPGHCDHLRRRIKEKFDIEVTERDWQHWNGGVFLFDAGSVEFMRNWHCMTLEVFGDPAWRTRDQGTLVATVWKMGLQDQALLPKEFNFLADYYTAELELDPERGFSLDGFRTAVQPYFAHVIHHFGDKDWAVWRWVLGR